MSSRNFSASIASASRLRRAACAAALVASALGPHAAGAANAADSKAADYTAGTLVIRAPWARATPQGAAAGAAYLTVTNKGRTPTRLNCLSSEAAAHCQVHQIIVHDGVTQMRPVAGGLQVAPGQTVTLKPGGYHIMLIQLRHPLQQGKTFAATLQAGDGATVTVHFPVAAVGAPAPAPAGETNKP